MNTPIPELTILDAIKFTADAWNHVEPVTITSSWRKTGIIPQVLSSIDEFLYLPLDIKEDDEAIQCLIDQFRLQNPLTAREYLEIDLTLQSENILDDDVIIFLVQNEEAIEEEEELETIPPIITS